MRFNFSKEARRANEKYMGISYMEQSRIPMDMLDKKVTPCKKESVRQVTPRGSVYLQMNRKASVASIRKIIANY